MEPTNKHRNRGNNQCLPGYPGGRRWLRKQSIYAVLRGQLVSTPDGFGIILGDSNQFGGSRKFIVRLDDGRRRRYSASEIHNGTMEFNNLMHQAWEERWD